MLSLIYNVSSPSSIRKSFSELHIAKAQSSILVTLLGIVMLVRALQALNAELPILVTLLGIVTLVRPEQPSNA